MDTVSCMKEYSEYISGSAISRCFVRLSLLCPQPLSLSKNWAVLEKKKDENICPDRGHPNHLIYYISSYIA